MEIERTSTESHNNKALEEYYNNTKWYYFIPLIGYFISYNNLKIAFDKSRYTIYGSPEHQRFVRYNAELIRKMHIFLIVYLLFAIVIFNVAYLVGRRWFKNNEKLDIK